MSWGSSEELLPAGGDAGSTIDDVLNAWWVRIRKFLVILVTDTTPTALGSGADENNPSLKAALVDDSTIEITGNTQINVKDAGITLAKHASDSVDENKIVSTTLGKGLAGGSGTTLSVDGVVEQGTGAHELKPKVFDIGDWDMDATAYIEVTHGLDFAKIHSVSARIRDDSNTYYFFLTQGSPVTDADVCVEWVTATKVRLRRDSGGAYDNTSYNSTGFNRGSVLIWYEV